MYEYIIYGFSTVAAQAFEVDKAVTIGMMDDSLDVPSEKPELHDAIVKSGSKHLGSSYYEYTDGIEELLSGFGIEREEDFDEMSDDIDVEGVLMLAGMDETFFTR